MRVRLTHNRKQASETLYDFVDRHTRTKRKVPLLECTAEFFGQFSKGIVEMSLDSGNHASSHTLKGRKSMDTEIHDGFDSEFSDLGEAASRLSSQPDDDSDNDSEDDSFGEASDECQPDHQFLEQVLEECHPERLNLLDPTVPESVYKKTTTSTGLPAGNVSADRDTGEPASRGLEIRTRSMSRSTASRQININEEGVGSDAKTGETDTFDASPRKFRRRDQSKMLGSVGKSTKKSLRTINSTFWAQPFKGLSQNLRGNGKPSQSPSP